MNFVSEISVYFCHFHGSRLVNFFAFLKSAVKTSVFGAQKNRLDNETVLLSTYNIFFG